MSKIIKNIILFLLFSAPGIAYGQVNISRPGSDADNIGQFINDIYQTAIIVGIIGAVGMIVAGGIYYTISGASKDKISEAKDMITSALSGLALLLGVFLILNTVNPEITGLSGPNVNQVSTSTYSAPSCSSERAQDLNLDACGGDDPFPTGSDEAQCCKLKDSSCPTDIISNCENESGGSINIQRWKVGCTSNPGGQCVGGYEWQTVGSEMTVYEVRRYAAYPEGSPSEGRCVPYAWKENESSDWEELQPSTGQKTCN